MRLLALYLPQYHEIPENDEWWGRGYTEWTAVKKARPLFNNHHQPNVPLDDNYYDLSEESGTTLRWQAELANEYGVYGFCFYHYWFGSKQLLQKPMEVLLNHPEIDINYCICWANETWTRTWYDKQDEVLIQQKYGDLEGRRSHYEYLSHFFKDKRYIKIDNSPVVCIYRAKDIPEINKMIKEWTEYAKRDGFSGVYFIKALNSIDNSDENDVLFSAEYMFEPGFSTKNGLNITDILEYYSMTALNRIHNFIFKDCRMEQIVDIKKVYKRSLKNYFKEKKKNKEVYIGICPRWDNTPRRGEKGVVYANASPIEFEKQLKRISKIVEKEDFVFINAWNEWGEGAYLEPDKEYKHAFLEAIRTVFILENCNEGE